MITLSTVDQFDDLKSLSEIYHQAFPPEERRPWADILERTCNNGPNLLGIYEDEDLRGMLTFWRMTDFVYIEHFVVDPDYRNLGIGSQALESFCKSVSPLPIVLEAEHPTNETAMHRLGFYRRHGFEVIDDNYVQPPYLPGLLPVELLLLANHRPTNPAKLIHELHSRVYNTD